MKETQYRGEAQAAGGETFTTTGTIQECACWAENIIRARDENITVRIRRLEEKQDGK